MNRICRKDVRPEGSGFTLVEIIVATSLLAFSMVAIFSTMSLCSIAAHHARMLNQSVLLAERLLVETRLKPITAFETREGQEGPYRWQVQIAPTPIEGLAAVRVNVRWQEQQRPQRYALSSLARMIGPRMGSRLSSHAKIGVYIG